MPKYHKTRNNTHAHTGPFVVDKIKNRTCVLFDSTIVVAPLHSARRLGLRTLSAAAASLAVAAAAATTVTTAAHAASSATWTATSNWNWDSPANWTPAAVPGTSATDAGNTIHFDISDVPFLTGKTITLLPDTYIGTLNVSGASAVSFDTLTFSGGHIHADSGNGTPATIRLLGGINLDFDAPITAASDLTFDNASAVLGQINLNAATNAASHNVTFAVGDIYATSSINVPLSAATLTKTGSGTLVFNSPTANSIAGPVHFNGGTLVFNTNNALGTGSGALVIGAGGGEKTLSLGGSSNIALSNALDLGDSLFVTAQTGATATTLSLNPSTPTTTTLGTATRSISVAPGLTFDIGANQSFTGTGTLTKIGGGTLVLHSNASDFTNLTVNAGTLVADTDSGSSAINGVSGILGKGNITVSGANSTLLLTGSSATATYTLSTNGSITVGADAILATSTARLVLNGGTLTLNGGWFNANGPVTLGATTINGTPGGGTLNFGGDLTVLSTPATLSNFSFDFTNTAAATLGVSSSTTIAFSKPVIKSGTGTSTFAASANTVAFSGGLEMRTGTVNLGTAATATGTVTFNGGGTLAFGKPNQMASTSKYVFNSGNGGVQLNGFNQTTYAVPVTIATGQVGAFYLGGSATTATRLDLGNITFGTNSVLSIHNYLASSAADIVTTTSNLNADQLAKQVWFYGYNRGATLGTGTNKSLTPANGFLQVEWTGGGNDNNASNYANWRTTDSEHITHPLALPNAPGVEINFGTLNGGIAGKTILGSGFTGDWTVGKINVTATGTTHTIDFNPTGGKLVFDSGKANTAAIINLAGTKWSTYTGAWRLDSDLKFTDETGTNQSGRNELGAYIKADISGSKNLIIENTSDKEIFRDGFYGLRFYGDNSGFTGNIIVKSGSIARQTKNAFGDVTSATLLNGTTNNIIFEGNGGIRGMANYQKIDIPNKIIIQGDIYAHNVNFTWKGSVDLNATRTISVNEPTRTPGERTSLTFSADTELTGTGGLIKEGLYSMEILSANNSFSGGLTVTDGALWTTVGSDGMSIGKAETNKNYLGSGNITIASVYAEGAFIYVDTQGNPVDIGPSSSAVAISLGSSNNKAENIMAFQGGGTVTLGANARVKSSGYNPTFLVSGDLILGHANNFGEGGAINLTLDTSTNPFGSASVSATASGDFGGIQNLNKVGAGIVTLQSSVTLQNSVTFKVNNAVYLRGGILKLTAGEQVQDGSGGTTNIEFAGGALDASGVTQGFSTAYLKTGGGSVILGATGRLTFNARTTSGNDWNDTFLVQRTATGGWQTNETDPGAFVRFSSNPATTGNTAWLSKVYFTGYETPGGAITSNSGYYYLTPANGSTPTTEWLGNGGGDTNWSNSANWLGGAVPNRATNDGNATIRDLDPSLDMKTITVDGTHNIARLNVGAFSPFVTLGGTGTLTFAEKGTINPRIAHTGGSIFTVGANVDITGSVELATQAAANVAYVRWENPVSGTGSFNKTGTGTLLLMDAPSSYSGGFNWNEPSLIQLGAADATANTSQKYFGNGTLTIGNGDANKTFVFETYNEKLAFGDVNDANTARYVSSPLVLRGNLTIQRQTNLGTLLTNTSTTQSAIHFTGNTTFGGESSDTGKTFTLTTYGTDEFSHTSTTQLYFDGNVSGNANIKQMGYGQVYYNGDNSSYTGNYTFQQGDVLFAQDNPFGTTGLLTLATGQFQILHSLNPNGVSIPNRLNFTGSGAGFRGIINFDYDSIQTNQKSQLGSGTLDFGSEEIVPTIVTFGKNHILEGSAKLVFGVQSSFNFRGTARFLGPNEFTGQIDISQGPVQTGRDSNGSSGGLGTGTIRFMAPTAMIGAYVGPDSINPAATSITMANPISFSNSAGVTILNTGVGVNAPTLIWTTPTIALRNGKSDFVLNINNVNETDQQQVLRIQSQLVNNTAGNPGGITKTGTGTLVLINTNNAIGAGIQVQSGVVRTEFNTATGTLNNTNTSVDAAFGTGTATGANASRLAQSADRVSAAGSFEIKALTANATLTLQDNGLARYTLNDNGQLRITGTNVTTVLASGAKLESGETDSARIGALVAEKVTATNFTLGVQMKTSQLTLAGSSTGNGLKLTRNNLFADTTNFILGTNGLLTLNGTTQAIPLLTVTGNSTINMDGSGFTIANPLTLTFDSITINTGSLLKFANWSGSSETGLGQTRVIANIAAPGSNLFLGSILTGVQFANDTSTNQAIVKLAADGAYVIVPFDNAFIWDGTASNNWELGNWTHMSDNNHTNNVAPGTTANSPASVIFDTTKTKFSIGGPSIPANSTVNITGSVYLTGLEFRGATKSDYTLTGGTLMFDSGSYGANTGTTITNSGVSDVLINSPIVAVFSKDHMASHSETLFIQQNSTGNLTFMQQISGPMAGLQVSGNGSGYIAFKGNNTISREFVLVNGRVLIGSDTALGSGTVRWQGGSFESVDDIANSTTAQDHSLSNNYDLNANNGTLNFLGTGNLTLERQGGVKSNTTLHIANAGTTLTLGSSPRRLDAATAGATLTLTGLGNVVINAERVGEAGTFRPSGPLGEDITTGTLNINIKNASTLFHSTVVDANIQVFNGARADFGAPPTGTATYGGTVTVDSGATLDLTGPGNRILRGLSHAGTLNVLESARLGGATTGTRAGWTLNGDGTVNLTANKTLTLETNSASTSATSTFTGTITGQGNLEKAGSGTQYLTGDNTYSGSTTVTAGELRVTGTLNSVGTATKDYASAIAVSSGAKLTFAQNNAQTFSGAATGAGDIEKSGAGLFTVTSSMSGVQFTAKSGATVALDNTQGGAHGVIQNATFEANATLQGNGTVNNATFGAGAILSPGTTTSPIGILNFGTNTASTTNLTGILYNVNIVHDSSGSGTDFSDLLNITGSAVFSGTNTLNITGVWQDRRKMEYTILSTTNGVSDGNNAWSNTTFTFNGSSLDPHRLVTLKPADNGNDLLLHTIDAYYALYWNGTAAASDWTSLWDASAPANWVRASELSASSPADYKFKNGDVVIFSDNANVSSAVKTVTIANVGVEPNTMIVDGPDSVFTFNGGAITVTNYTQVADDYFDEYDVSGVPVVLSVQNGAQARFNVAVSAPKMNVTGGAFAILGDTSDASFTMDEIYLGGSGNAGTVVFDRSGTNHSSFSGVISGTGDVLKTGANATMTLRGNSSYTGKTTVSGGTLLVTGSLGGASREYTGEVRLTASGATLGFSGADTDVQKLSGRLEGVVGSVLAVGAGRQLEITSDWNNTPTAYPAAPGVHNNFRGDLVVSGAGTHLTVSGRLDVQSESFDGGTPWAATYTQSNYHGNMNVSNNATLEFTYNRDWQVTTGALTGMGGADAGTFKVNTGMPFYFMGTGAGFGGNTVVTGGSVFHLPAGGVYGAAGAGNSGTFEVTGNSVLVGGSGSTPTTLNAAALLVAGGSTLSVVPGGFRVNVANAAGVTLASGATLRIAVAAGMALPAGTYTAGAVGPTTTRAPASGAGSAAVSFAATDGTVFSGGQWNGVTLVPGTVLNLNVGGTILVHGPDFYEYVLMDGLDTLSLINSFGYNDPALAMKAIFGTDSIQVMGAQFQLIFSENKLLMTQISLSSTIPEPSTYALVGGLGVLGLAFWRKRKRAK